MRHEEAHCRLELHLHSSHITQLTVLVTASAREESKVPSCGKLELEALRHCEDWLTESGRMPWIAPTNMASPVASSILPSTTTEPELFIRGKKRLSVSSDHDRSVEWDALHHEAIPFPIFSLFAKSRNPAILTRTILEAGSSSGLGESERDLDVLVEVGGDRVYLVLLRCAGMFDLLSKSTPSSMVARATCKLVRLAASAIGLEPRGVDRFPHRFLRVRVVDLERHLRRGGHKEYAFLVSLN